MKYLAQFFQAAKLRRARLAHVHSERRVHRLLSQRNDLDTELLCALRAERAALERFETMSGERP